MSPDMPDLAVSRSLPGDIPAWLRLAEEVEPEFGAAMTSDSGWIEALEAHIARGTALCARVATDDTMLGGMWLEMKKHSVEISWLAVFVEHRRQGAGRALVDTAIARGGELRVEVVTFGQSHPMVDAATAARQLYTAAGFTRAEHVPPAGPDGTSRIALVREPQTPSRHS